MTGMMSIMSCNFGYMQSCASTDIYLPIMVSILKEKGECSIVSCNFDCELFA